jgi:phospholipase/carboxylesterase
MSETTDDQLLTAITELVPVLLNTMEAFEHVQQNMHPSSSGELAQLIEPFANHLGPIADQFSQLNVSGHAATAHEFLAKGASYTLQACENFATGAASHNGMGSIMRAMRSITRAQEAIYPVASIMTPISRYFLELPLRSDAALLAGLKQDQDKHQTGILNADNQRGTRGGFTVYVPENTIAEEPLPLVVALHGGTGHGADFLWSWLREARGRGFILLSPTSQQDTWSLMGADYDSAPLRSMVDYVKQNWCVDEDHVLLTGLSDGATFTLLSGLQADSPFTHLAPLSGVLHPENFINGNMARASNKPIYLVHGTLDWMFPIETAHMARDELLKADADLVFREIEDLSHNYARAENDPILRWFSSNLALPN